MRWPSPGDEPLRDLLQDETQNLNRVHLGQAVAAPNGALGTVSVAIQNTGQIFTAQIPTHSVSINGFKSSWQRYMPQNNDFFKVAFGPDGRPYLLGHTMWGTTGPGGDKFNAGYAQVQAAANRGESALTDFVQLRPGEWDSRSSGGAYIHGSDQGRLLLSGGTTKIELRKQRDEAEHRAGLTIVHNGSGSQLRLGEVKRSLPTNLFQESSITGATNELAIDVKTTGVLPLAMYQSRVGDVRDSLGIIETLGGVPLRARHSYYDPTGATTGLEVKVNNLGSVEVTHGIAALDGLRLTSTTGPLNTTYFNTTIDSTVASNLTAGVRVALGSSTAIEPLVHGLLWTTARAIQHGTQAGAHTTMSAAFTALASAMGVLLAKIPPITDPDLLAVVTALATFAAAGAATETVHQTALTTFESGSATYLSTKVFTE